MNKENLAGEPYVWLHGDETVAGITYRGTYYLDFGYYTIGGARPLLLPRELVDEWEIPEAAIRPASTEERIAGCRFERVATEYGVRWAVPSAPYDYDHTDVVVHYRDGTDSRLIVKYEPATPFEEALDDVVFRYLGPAVDVVELSDEERERLESRREEFERELEIRRIEEGRE